MGNKYIICDLDGCLIDTSWIWRVADKLGLKAPQNYEFFDRNANASFNKVDLPLYKYLCFKASGGLKIHFLTARSEKIEVETINFIQQKTGLILGEHFTASFRPLDDCSASTESKRRRLENMLDNNKEVVLAIDDSESIINMYKEHNIKAVKWINGFIPFEVAKEFGSQFNNLITEKEELCQN